MTALATKAGSDFNKILSLDGQRVRFRYFTGSPSNAGSSYDNVVTLSTSGSDLWVTGVVLPVYTPRGNDEAVLMEQGRVLVGDDRLYVAGNVQTSGLFKVWIGSPAVLEYALTDMGVNELSIAGTPIYRKLYVRYLTTGSLMNE